jgi:hypothetical protein
MSEYVYGGTKVHYLERWYDVTRARVLTRCQLVMKTERWNNQLNQVEVVYRVKEVAPPPEDLCGRCVRRKPK